MTRETPSADRTDRTDDRRTASGAIPSSRRTVLKTAGLGAGALALGLGPGTGSVAADQHGYNFAEALQQSVLFYDANHCGPDVTGGRLLWRGDCHTEDTAVPLEESVENGGTNLSQGFIDQYRDILDPDGDGTVDVSGGFHDAGDHVKFGMPQAYSASTLAWAAYEFEEAFRDVGSYDHIVDHVRRFADYFMKCTFRDDDGDVVAFCYQVSNGGQQFDHNYWGPPELQDPDESPRPAYFATPNDPASDRSAAAAAALAIISQVLEDEDPAYAADCLDTAEALYAFADEHRAIPDTASGYYDSSSDADDLCFAAVWLYVATGEDAYLEDAIGTDGSGNFTGHISEIIDTVQDDWNNRWVYSWDNIWGGVFMKLTDITDDDRWRDLAYWNLAYWSGGDVEHQDGSSDYIDTTPAGFSFLNQWGSARYNAAAQFMAVLYRKYTGNTEVTDWALSQMQYIMGDNPFGYSLIVGVTDDHAEHPHHDAAHGTLSGRPEEPEDHRHTLWGALVGGPDSNDNHVDETNEYQLNEVAIDYNAGLVGALAGLYTYYADDDQPLETVPPEDERTVPFYAEASVDETGSSSVAVDATLHVDDFYPPLLGDDVSVRYLFDLDGGADDVAVDVANTAVGVDGPTAGDDRYFLEFDFGGVDLGGEHDFSFELDASDAVGFDPADHWSRQGLGTSPTVAEYMPVYVDGEHLFGELPDGEGSSGGDTIAVGEYETRDTTDDGLYNDFDGDGETTHDDVTAFFETLEDDGVQSNADAFDFDDNGRIGFGDVIDLLRRV